MKTKTLAVIGFTVWFIIICFTTYKLFDIFNPPM